jgi:hypothetical protein
LRSLLLAVGLDVACVFNARSHTTRRDVLRYRPKQLLACGVGIRDRASIILWLKTVVVLGLVDFIIGRTYYL